jgi:hypothetical protein
LVVHLVVRFADRGELAPGSQPAKRAAQDVLPRLISRSGGRCAWVRCQDQLYECKCNRWCTG